jgi:hypothetical protein
VILVQDQQDQPARPGEEHDIDQDPQNFLYSWYVNGVDVGVALFGMAAAGLLPNVIPANRN